MKTYIRLFGPGLKSAIERLEDLSIIHEELVHQKSYLPLLEPSKDEDHLRILQQGHVFVGSYDFVFTWKESPSEKDINALITEIDASFKDVSARYTITTVPDESTSPETYVKIPEDWNEDSIQAISYLTVFGPPLLDVLTELENMAKHVASEQSLPIEDGRMIIGRYDFAFAWKKQPTTEEVLKLTQLLDEVFQPRKAMYSIDTMTS